MRDGCYDSQARLEDMNRAGVLASLCFPSFPRFCGQAFSEIDVLLALFALPAIGVPISAALSKVPTAPVAFTVVATCSSFLAVLLVLFRLLDQPGSNELVAVEYGAWIGLAGAVLALVGSWLAMADDHTPGAVPPQLPVRPAP